MTKGTFWVEEGPCGGFSIGIEDYGVEEFGGADYEWIYTLDLANTQKMFDALAHTHFGLLKEPYDGVKGALERMIEAEFGIHLDKKSIRLWFRQNSIEFEFFSWVS